MGKGGDSLLPSIRSPKRAQLSLTTTQPHPFGQAGGWANNTHTAAMAPLPQLVSKRLGRPKQRAARPRSRSRQVSLPAAPPQPLGLGGLAITGTAPVVTGSRALNPHALSGKRAAVKTPAPPVDDEAGSTIQLRLKSWGEAPLFETVSDADSDAQGTVAVQIKSAPKADGLQFVAAPTAANSPKNKKEDGDRPGDTVAPVPLAAKELEGVSLLARHHLSVTSPPTPEMSSALDALRSADKNLPRLPTTILCDAESVNQPGARHVIAAVSALLQIEPAPDVENDEYHEGADSRVADFYLPSFMERARNPSAFIKSLRQCDVAGLPAAAIAEAAAYAEDDQLLTYLELPAEARQKRDATGVVMCLAEWVVAVIRYYQACQSASHGTYADSDEVFEDLSGFEPEPEPEPEAEEERVCEVCFEKGSYRISTGCDHTYCGSCIKYSLEAILSANAFPACCPKCRADEQEAPAAAPRPRTELAKQLSAEAADLVISGCPIETCNGEWASQPEHEGWPRWQNIDSGIHFYRLTKSDKWVLNKTFEPEVSKALAWIAMKDDQERPIPPLGTRNWRCLGDNKTWVDRRITVAGRAEGEKAGGGVVTAEALAFFAQRALIGDHLYFRCLQQTLRARSDPARDGFFLCPNRGCTAALQRKHIEPALVPLGGKKKGFKSVKRRGQCPSCNAVICPDCHLCARQRFAPHDPDKDKPISEGDRVRALDCQSCVPSFEVVELSKSGADDEDVDIVIGLRKIEGDGAFEVVPGMFKDHWRQIAADEAEKDGDTDATPPEFSILQRQGSYLEGTDEPIGEGSVGLAGFEGVGGAWWRVDALVGLRLSLPQANTTSGEEWRDATVVRTFPNGHIVKWADTDGDDEAADAVMADRQRLFGVALRGKLRVPAEGYEHVCPLERHVDTKVDKASAKLMSKVCKPCPNCGVMVQKNDGCDMMMCGTVAHGSMRDAVRNGGCGFQFDWRTGKESHGARYNPNGRGV